MADVPAFVALEEAQRIVREHTRPTKAVAVPLDAALGMTLAEPIRCDTDMPPFDRAMMDGFAVLSGDVARPGARLEVVGKVTAGEEPPVAVRAGQAVRINTGAPMPPGADAVVKVEDTQSDGGWVTVAASYKPEQNVCRRGTYVSCGQVVLNAGTRLGPSRIAVAASAGVANPIVFDRPRVGALVTGDEVVEAGSELAAGRIRNSNGPLLMALFRREGLVPEYLGIAGDSRPILEQKIRQGLAGDVLCITGGVSMGTMDLVPEVLAGCGVKFHFRKMATKPGKPTLFGTSPDGCCVFGLPGNPISAFVGYWTLVRTCLAAMQGRGDAPSRPVRAVLTGGTAATKERMSFWPARVGVGQDGRFAAEPLRWSGSGDPFGMTEANGMIVRPAHSPAAEPGEVVDVMLLEWE